MVWPDDLRPLPQRSRLAWLLLALPFILAGCSAPRPSVAYVDAFQLPSGRWQPWWLEQPGSVHRMVGTQTETRDEAVGLARRLATDYVR